MVGRRGQWKEGAVREGRVSCLLPVCIWMSVYERNARGVVLQQAGFGERVRAALADDVVIQYPDIYQ